MAITIQNGIVRHARITQQTTSIGYNTRQERQLTAIDRICTHHSVTNNMPTIANLNNAWTGGGRNWNRAGYHFIIRNDGSIWQLVPIWAPSWGAGAAGNPRSIHISMAGTFTANTQPSAAARSSYGWLVRELLNHSALPNVSNLNTHVVGHRAFAATACPGVTDAQFRSWVPASNVTQPSTPSASGTHTVRSGETLWGIATQHNTTVQAIQSANNMGSSTNIFPGMVLRLPSTGIRTGQRVQVSNAPLFANATTATQSGVRSGTFYIWDAAVTNGRVRVTNQANRVGVAGQITGWMRVSDI